MIFLFQCSELKDPSGVLCGLHAQDVWRFYIKTCKQGNGGHLQ